MEQPQQEQPQLPAAAPQQSSGDMSQTGQDTQRLLQEIEACTQRMAETPDDDALYVERGRLYWQLRDLPRCFADYDSAVRLNPDSPARHLKTMVRNVMAFYHKDAYNP
jgi:cytochrome c-type biogenesis protein CcmH/NrfG